VTVNCNCTDTTSYRTLLQLRTDLMVALGYAVQAASPPPGMASLLTLHLQQAQRQIIQRFPSLRTERWFTWSLVAGERFYDFPDNDEGVYIYAPTEGTATPLPTGGTLSAATYTYRISALNANGETLASLVLAAVTSGATSRVSLDWSAGAVEGATSYKIYGRTAGAELYIASTTAVVLTYIDTGAITPAGALPAANTTAECTKVINQYQITWVGVEQDNSWYELRKGVNPVMLGYDETGWPQTYELRQCIEIWPAPAATSGSLRIKARFKPEAFTADSDKTTIDDDLVFMLALANLKAHYRQPDAGNYVSQFETHMMSLVAGTHASARYISGTSRNTNDNYVEPRTTVPFT
jgi:hypothetical protein